MRVSPYPGLTLRSHDGARQHSGMGAVADANEGRIQAIGQVKAISLLESLDHQRHSKTKALFEREFEEVELFAKEPAISNARALKQLINEMGGSGENTGPGQLLSMVV